MIVPKVGHGPKMGQYGFDRACFSVVFLFLLCFIAHLYEANGRTDMDGLLQARFFRRDQREKLHFTELSVFEGS